MKKKISNKLKSLTIIELIIAIACVAVLAAIVFIAINPSREFKQARDSSRDKNINAILNALSQYSVDHNGGFPAGIDENLRMIGTSVSGCLVTCGASQPVASIDYHIKENNIKNILIPEIKATEIENKEMKKDPNYPLIINSYVTPQKVVEGDKMNLTVESSDNFGIVNITAKIADIDTVELKLIKGDIKNGIWSADWIVHSTKIEKYLVTFIVINNKNFTSTSTVPFEDPPLSGWVSPNSVTDPNNQWTNEHNSIDGNLISYATNTYGGAGWGQYIYFSLTNPIYSNKVRLNVDYLDPDINSVDIDVYVNNIWVNAFEGGSESLWNVKWAEVSFPAGQVTQARFRYNYKVGGYYYWLYEFQFYEALPTIILPSTSTQSADMIQDTYATVSGLLNDDGGESCSYRFSYGLTPIYSDTTDWISPIASGEIYNDFINGLTPNQTYHFRAEVKNSVGISLGEDKTFKTKSAIIGVVSPDGFLDPANSWENEILATDKNTSTYARSYHNMNSSQWSNFIYYSHSEIIADNVIFNAKGGSEIDSIDVDVLLDGSWINALESSFTDRTPVTLNFTQGKVTQVRIRFHATNANNGFFFQLYEVSFNKSNEGTGDTCVDLSTLAPVYIDSIPVDPLIGSSEKTYYAIKKLSNNNLIIYSCDPEIQTEISVKR